MGKKTLFHPVSLHVIRGAAEFCGWTFAKLEQVDSEPERLRARYRAEITGFPVDPHSMSVMMLHNLLAECFMDDIKPHWLRCMPDGKWLVDIQVDLSESKQKPAESLTVEQWQKMRDHNV